MLGQLTWGMEIKKNYVNVIDSLTALQNAAERIVACSWAKAYRAPSGKHVSFTAYIYHLG